MNIYIAFDHENEPLGLILSTNKERANIAFCAMGETPSSLEEIDTTSDDIGVHGTAFILTSKEIYPCSGSSKTIRKWKRGLWN